MFSRCLVLLTAVALLGATLIIKAQEKGNDNARAGQEEERARFAKKFEKYERNLKVSIKAKEQYRVGENVDVDVMLTNNSTEALGNYIFHQFLQETVDLTKDGRPVNYRKDKDISPEETVRRYGIANTSTIGVMPDQTKVIRTINLLDWYGSLETGTYQLTLGHRFWGKGKPVKSNTVTFEVVP